MLNLPSAIRGTIFFASAGNNGRGILSFSLSGVGAASGKWLEEATAVEVTYGTNEISFANTAGAIVTAFVMYN